MFIGAAILVLAAVAWTGLEHWQTRLRQRPSQFFRAVQADDVKTLASLLADDPALSFLNMNYTPEEWAMRHRARQSLTLLLRRHPNGQLPQSSNGKPLLHIAATYPWTIAPLVNHGASLEAKDKDGNTALIATMKEFGTPKNAVADLLQAGANPKATNSVGETALHYSHQCSQQDLQAIQSLVKAGADVNAKDQYGRTPLHAAMARQSGFLDDATKALCTAGADLCARDAQGKTPGQLAVDKGDTAIARELWRRHLEPLVKARKMDQIATLLKGDPNAVSYGQGASEGTLLHWACAEDDAELARLLLDHGADANAKDDRGRTPLWGANPAACELLLQRGADPTLPDKTGQTVLRHAMTYGNTAKTTLLLRHQPALAHSPFATRDLAMGQHPDAERMKTLLAAGAPNDIFSAIILGETDRLRTMLQANPKLATEGHAGVPLLIPAIRARHDDIAQLLLENGADPNKVTDFESFEGRLRTPLHEALSYNRKNVVRLLLDHGADPNARSHGGEMSLHWAIWRDPETVRWLLAKGADVRATDRRGRTPLHAAAEFPTNPEVVRLLIAAGADLNAKDNSGRTPAQAAGPYPDVKAILLAATTRPATMP